MAPSLEDLLNQGLGGILEGGGLGNEEALYQRQAQAERESTFGRGLGISSVTRDALAKARVDASLAAQQAQLSALGQAAGITQGNANRTQQASQFGQNLDQRNKELGQQESLANKQMLASGIGAGTGALLNVAGMAFRPQIQDFLGVNSRGPISPGGGREVMAPPSAVPDLIGDGGGGGGLADLSTFSGAGDFSMPDFAAYSNPADYDFGDFGGFDLSGLFDTSFTPYEWGYM
jgi:hypothetical protein